MDFLLIYKVEERSLMNQMDKILYRMWVRAIKAAVTRKDWKNAKIYKRELMRITKKYE